MKTRFYLAWLKPSSNSNKSWRQGFKNEAASSLIQEYTRRVHKFSPCEINGVSLENFDRKQLGQRPQVWICDLSAGSIQLSSEEIAKKMAGLLNSGAGSLNIFIGGADGWSKKNRETLKPDFRWSFGPITLPHEIAAVIAAEQIYRAHSILRGLPYHHA